MDEPGLVRAPEGPAHLDEDGRRGRGREAPLAPEPQLEVLALEQLHHDEGRVVLDAVVVDLDDVRALELRARLRLALEARARVGGGGELGRHELDRHVDVELQVPRRPTPIPCRPARARGSRRYRPAMTGFSLDGEHSGGDGRPRYHAGASP